MTEKEICERLGITKAALDYLFESGKLTMNTIKRPRVFSDGDIKVIREVLYNQSHNVRRHNAQDCNFKTFREM